MSNKINAILNPSNISYGFIGITTAILGYYTFFENNIEDVSTLEQDVSVKNVSNEEEPTQELSTPTQELSTPTQELSTPTQELSTPTQELSTPTQELSTYELPQKEPATIIGGKKKKSRRRK
jgi:predicted RNA-binding protein with RPS1 domain